MRKLIIVIGLILSVYIFSKIYKNYVLQDTQIIAQKEQIKQEEKIIFSQSEVNRKINLNVKNSLIIQKKIDTGDIDQITESIDKIFDQYNCVIENFNTNTLC